MAALPRSEVSFRRQGSSGLVWDDRFLSGELNKVNQQQQSQGEEEKEQQHWGENSKEIHATNTSITVQRSRSNGGGRGYRTGKVSPAIEPPSPKLSACGFCHFCGAFGNKTGKKGQWSKPGKRRSR